MKLAVCQKIANEVLSFARSKNFKPMGVVVLDARAAVRVVMVEDGTSQKRAEVAHGKANASLAMGTGSRGLEERAKQRPHFMAAAPSLVGGPFMPVTGAVIVRDAAGDIVGAVGVSGDTSDNDEACALHAVAAVGLKADTGA